MLMLIMRLFPAPLTAVMLRLVIAAIIAAALTLCSLAIERATHKKRSPYQASSLERGSFRITKGLSRR